uniref:Uncharacterized protein n=1 Tax=Oryza glumipatula TaxID=40148 RepID=A0A0E0B5L4_9ORYZ
MSFTAVSSSALQVLLSSSALPVLLSAISSGLRLFLTFSGLLVEYLKVSHDGVVLAESSNQLFGMTMKLALQLLLLVFGRILGFSCS